MELKDIVALAWNSQHQALKSKVSLAAQQVSDILLVEAERKGSHQAAQLQKTMGGFAHNMMDLGAVSKVLDRSRQKSGLDEKSLVRIQKLSADLQKWVTDFDMLIPGCAIRELAPADTLETECAQHLNAMAHCFRLIRMAWLERNSKYEPAIHDPFFADFTWESLTNEEVSLCPPYVITLQDKGEKDFFPSTILPLLTCGLPIKVVLGKNSFRHHYQSFSRSTALRCALEIEMLPVALKGVYVIQDTTARSEASEALKQGLSSPRPGLFSIFSDSDSERCHQAVQSRALPIFNYDPDRSDVFLKRFNLEGNPDPSSIWADSTVEFMTANGKKDRLDRKVTFADFAATESAYQNDFSNLPADQESRAIAIADYLELKSTDRTGKLPFVYTLGTSNTLVKKVPSMKIVAQTADKRHLWKSLCEVAGVNNPHIIELEKQLRAIAKQEMEAALSQQKAELLSQFESEKDQAVEQAMRNLAAKLAGLNGAQLGSIANSSPTTTAKPASIATVKSTARAQSAKPAESDEPWIDSKSCTACDECVTIDPRIFAYDANKQAYIKDPKGGPYKNLLKASQKCSAKIIHPGKAPV